MPDFSMFVPNVHFEQIPIKNLVSNQEYQRTLSTAHVERAAEHFDLHQINPVKVSRRNGVNYVFNGQHTIEIVALVSGSRDTPVWCMIYDDLEYENKADIFANQMKYVKPLKPYEVFMANVEAENSKQLIIKDLVESYSLTIGQVKNYGVICAVSALERIYDKFGYHVLDTVLGHSVDGCDVALEDGEAGSNILDMLTVCLWHLAGDHTAVIRKLQRLHIVVCAARHKTADENEEQDERREDRRNNPASSFAQLFVSENGCGNFGCRCRSERHYRPPALPNSFSLYAGA